MNILRWSLKTQFNFVVLYTVVWTVFGVLLLSGSLVINGNFGSPELVIAAFICPLGGFFWSLTMWKIFVLPRIRHRGVLDGTHVDTHPTDNP